LLHAASITDAMNAKPNFFMMDLLFK